MGKNHKLCITRGGSPPVVQEVLNFKLRHEISLICLSIYGKHQTFIPLCSWKLFVIFHLKHSHQKLSSIIEKHLRMDIALWMDGWMWLDGMDLQMWWGICRAPAVIIIIYVGNYLFQLWVLAFCWSNPPMSNIMMQRDAIWCNSDEMWCNVL